MHRRPTKISYLLHSIVCIFSITNTHIYSGDETPQNRVWSLFKADLFIKLFQYLDVQTAYSLRLVAKGFNETEKLKQFFDYQNHYLHNKYEDDHSLALVETDKPSIFKPSLILSPDGKRYTSLIYNHMDYDHNKQFKPTGRLACGSGTLTGGEMVHLNPSTKPYSTYYSYVNVYFSKTAPLNGYRDPKGHFFLFMSPCERHPRDAANLMCLNWNAKKENNAEISCWGNLNLHCRNKNPEIERIEKDDQNQDIVIFVFIHKNISVFVDTKTKRVVKQERPWDPIYLKTPENSSRRENLISLINTAATAWKDNIGIADDVTIKLYIPSIVLNNDATRFKALGFPHDPNLKHRCSYFIKGKIHVTQDNQLAFENSTLHSLYPFNIIKSYINGADGKSTFPGFSDNQRVNFIFPAYIENGRIRGDGTYSVEFPLYLIALNAEMEFTDDLNMQFDSMLNEYPISNFTQQDNRYTLSTAETYPTNETKTITITYANDCTFNLEKKVTIETTEKLEKNSNTKIEKNISKPYTLKTDTEHKNDPETIAWEKRYKESNTSYSWHLFKKIEFWKPIFSSGIYLYPLLHQIATLKSVSLPLQSCILPLAVDATCFTKSYYGKKSSNLLHGFCLMGSFYTSGLLTYSLLTNQISTLHSLRALMSYIQVGISATRIWYSLKKQYFT